MNNHNVNRGLRPSGRIMLIVMVTIFFGMFVVTGVRFAVIAHTGMVYDRDLLQIALNTQLGTGQVVSRRGTITDRNGSVIVSQYPSHTMHANFHPEWGSMVADIEYTARQLATVMNLTFDDLYALLSNRYWTGYNEFGVFGDHPIWVTYFGDAGRRMTFSERNRIEALELPGIHFVNDLTRFYHHGKFAAHTVGYTIFSEDGNIQGAMGVESFFNDLLTGTDGRYQQQRDSWGILQPGSERYYITRPYDGLDIRLTLDESIQIFLETALDEVVDVEGIINMTAVVMHATTGEILAVGSRPTFDPNERNPAFYDNAMMYPFEPGSTIKIFTYAAAINEGNYNGQQFFATGPRSLPGDITIRNHQLIEDIDRTFDQGFFVSTNTSVIDLLRTAVTPDRFLTYLEDFGFGQPVGLPLFGEHPGRLPDINRSVVDVYISSFGQAIDVTPVQMLQATTAILNDGQMILPQIISEIYDPNSGTIIQSFEREVVGTPITAATARQVKDLMIGVVANDMGTGRVHYALDVPSGGKTGTAEVFNNVTGTYHTNRHIYSYIGFAPADEPELIMFVSIERETNPSMRTHPYVGQIYQFVMNNALSYLGLTQETSFSRSGAAASFERTTMPRAFNLTLDAATTAITDAGLLPVVIGHGQEVFNQFPMADSSVLVGERVFIQTDVEDTLPDFTGWTRAQITQYANIMDLNITIQGHGVGARQTLRAGRIVGSGDALSVTLE